MMDVPSIKAHLEEFHDQHTAAQADFRVRFTLEALNSLGRYLARLSRTEKPSLGFRNVSS